jgi:ATP-dependent DNA helicase RecG
MDKQSLIDIIALLRYEKNDNQYYEVKAAAGGFPDNALETISAFCNTPGGGTLIFGVDENLEFEVVGVYDLKLCRQTLANHAKKSFNVRVEMNTALIEFDGKLVVCAEIKEADKSLKPVMIANTGKSYIRMYDGDYELSDLEKQRFVAERGVSRYDEAALPGSGPGDLNLQLVDDYLTNRRAQSKVLAGMERDEVLVRTGVMTPSGELTVAGALSLGVYPQQFLPNYSIRASVRKRAKTSATVRAVNARTFDGPLSMILSEAVKWVRDNGDELIRDLPDGRVLSVNEYPPVAARELIANALIHRDLNPVSMVESISMTIEDSRLVISNPGGLYGIAVSELGRTGSRTRNSSLAEICQYITAEDGENVIEKLGTGIPKTLNELLRYHMRAPSFIDGGIYFTVALESGIIPADPVEFPGVSINEQKILAALRAAPLSGSEIEAATKLTKAQVRYALGKLLRSNKAVKLGRGKSPNIRYAVAGEE